MRVVILVVDLMMVVEFQSSASAQSAGETFKDCDACPLMVVIPPGSVQMRDLKGRKAVLHTVTIGYSFAVSKYEITQANWQAKMDSNPSAFGDDDRPVEQVMWKTVQEYVRKLSRKTGKQYRLLSESEWGPL